jgi:adenylate cyclase
MGRILGEIPGVSEAHATTFATPDRDAVIGQLERILSSGDFDASPRSRAFLSFIVEEALVGRQDHLTQSVIATRVFGRRENFDPTVDPIVRIQAGRLRRSLERYYLLSGADDSVRIELPRGTYVPGARWGDRAPVRSADAVASGGPRDPGGWPTVVVSLFETDDGTPELQAAANQLKEELCVEMGRYGDVRVVRRRDLDALGLRHGDFSLSGHVSRGEDGLRVRARLLDSHTASQAWAEEYAAPASAGGFWEESARRIAARVASEQGVVARQLWAEERQHPVSELSPYGSILRSYRFFFSRDLQEFRPACVALERTVRERPECGLAFVQLARLYSANYSFELAPGAPGRVEEAIALAQTGVRLDPDSQRARVALAGALMVKGELAAGRAEAETAYELNPDSFVYLEWIGWMLALLGDWERGVFLIRRSMERNANHIPVASHAIWANHLRLGEFEEAYQTALLYRDPTFFWRSLMRACCLGHLGRLAEAKLEVAELLQRKPDFPSRGRVLIGRHIKFPELFERIVAGLEKAGLALA